MMDDGIYDTNILLEERPTRDHAVGWGRAEMKHSSAISCSHHVVISAGVLFGRCLGCRGERTLLVSVIQMVGLARHMLRHGLTHSYSVSHVGFLILTG